MYAVAVYFQKYQRNFLFYAPIKDIKLLKTGLVGYLFD
jgi:hypothetical protein